jgi:hypothetical protein
VSNVLTSLIAVFAALAGSTLTFIFQWRTARHAEQFTREQELRHERIAAYSAFAAALTEFRRSENDRWHLEQDAPGSPEFVLARDESYQLRASATAELCRVHLVCGSLDLSQLAQAAFDATTEVHLAQDEQDRAGRGEKARLALEHFLATASAHVY